MKKEIKIEIEEFLKYNNQNNRKNLEINFYLNQNKINLKKNLDISKKNLKLIKENYNE